MTRYSGSSPAGRDGDACQAATLYTMNAMAPAATRGCGIDPEGLVCAMKPAATPAHTNKAVRPDHSNSAGGRGRGVQGRSTNTRRSSGAREAPRRAASHTPRPIASPAAIGHGRADRTAMRCAPWPVSTTGANVSQAATAATSDAPNRTRLAPHEFDSRPPAGTSTCARALNDCRCCERVRPRRSPRRRQPTGRQRLPPRSRRHRSRRRPGPWLRRRSSIRLRP